MQTLNTRSVIVALAASLLLMAWGSADAQMKPASAEIVQATGRVEVLPKGQTNWAAGAVGTRLVEGDQIRALANSRADLNLPDGSTILIAENTRFAVQKLDYDTATRDRDATFHVVAGKVRAQVSQAAVQIIRARQSNFNISTPNGVAAIRGTILITAYNPATQETLTFVFPSPGQSPSSARVSFVNRNGQAVTITGGNFVRQVGNQPPSAPTPITTLPAAVQAALQTAQNQQTLGATDLIAIGVVIPSAEQTQNLVNPIVGTTTIPVSNPLPGGNTGGCNGCGQDINPKNNPPPTPTCPPGRQCICASPPCEE
jgi:hypothetical protein